MNPEDHRIKLALRLAAYRPLADELTGTFQVRFFLCSWLPHLYASIALHWLCLVSIPEAYSFLITETQASCSFTQATHSVCSSRPCEFSALPSEGRKADWWGSSSAPPQPVTCSSPRKQVKGSCCLLSPAGWREHKDHIVTEERHDASSAAGAIQPQAASSATLTTKPWFNS